MPLTDCEIELNLSWTKDCVLIEQNNNIAGINFALTSSKLYAPVVTFSINDNITFLENIRQGFKSTTSWNKYLSEIMTQPRNNNLDCLIDPAFRNINRCVEIYYIKTMETYCVSCKKYNADENSSVRKTK